MSDRFAAQALRLCALAARGLGWRPAEFWSATPAELAAIFVPDTGGVEPLARTDLTRMMEQEHG